MCQSIRFVDWCPFLILSFDRKGAIGLMKTDSVGIYSSEPSSSKMSESLLFIGFLTSAASDSSIGSIEMLSYLLEGG